MKKWMSLLLAGALVSAFLVGCKKEEEGTPETAPATGKDGGKMDEKKEEGATPGTDTKMDGGAAPGGDTKMDGGAAPGGDTKTGDAGGTPPAGDTKTEEKKGG